MAYVATSEEAAQPYSISNQQAPSSTDLPPPPDSPPPPRHIPAGYVVCDECDELVPKPQLATHQSTLCSQALATCTLSHSHYDICHLHTTTTTAQQDDNEEGEEAEHTREQIAQHVESAVGVHVLYLMDVVSALQQQVSMLAAELTIERKRRVDMEDQIKQVITTLAEKVDHAQVARFSAPSVAYAQQQQPRAVVRTTSGRVVQKRGVGERDRDDDRYPVRSSLQYSPTFSSSASSPFSPVPFDPLLDKPLAPSASAWKPAVKSKPDTSSSAFLAARSTASASASASPSQAADTPSDPAALTKRIHSTLNKLTPTNYDKLATQLVALFQSITSPALLATLTGQLFDKALEDIFFGSMYARLCKVLAVEVKGVGGDAKASFRYFLLNKCQDEFVRFVAKEEQRKKDEDDEQKAEKNKDGQQDEQKEVVEEEKKEEGEASSAAAVSVEAREVARAAPKRRFIAAIRFIGELFLQDLVTLPIMIACITQLLTNVRDEAGEASEDSIQGLCKLLTTVGGAVEEKEEARERMRPVWASMRAEAEADNKHSSRGRFALLDVLDARAKGWKQREAQKGQSASNEKLTTPPATTVAAQPVMRLGFDEPARGGGGGGSGGGGSERDRMRERERERERELIPQNTSDARLAQASAMATTVKRWTPGVRKVVPSSADHPT